MNTSMSKESLVFHETREDLSDKSESAPQAIGYGSTDDDEARFPLQSSLKSPSNSTKRKPFQDVGPKARQASRREMKSLRLSSRTLVTHKPFLEVFKDMILGNSLNILLLAMPVAYASHRLEWSSTSIFMWNFIAMIPLAALLGDFTEEVAAHTNQTVGGLINASFGNAVEVVVSIQALIAGEIRVVQASMIGSIFSNLLLVLGSCFLFGGIKYKEQTFESMTATSNMGLLALSSIAMVLPTQCAAYYDLEEDSALGISRIAAVFLIIMYMQLLFFQLHTHADLMEDDDEEETEMSFSAAIFGLVGITAIITKFSDYLVESIDGFCLQSGMSRTFVGLIILPIVGNAVEHSTAISVAMKNKMDLAMGVAVGSSVQISLFVAPLTVLIGWGLGQPMSFNFPHFELTLFILSTVVVAIILSNSKSNWLEGSMLITTYILVAVGFWYEKVVEYKPSNVEL